MREIKFRALYEGVWYYQTLDEILTITLAAFRNGNHKTQFTGLHDKNKNPIYEGDFVKIVVPGFSEGDESFIIEGVVSFVDHGWNVVKSNKGKFNFNSNYYFGRIVDHPFEIVGNIYESPLIK